MKKLISFHINNYNLGTVLLPIGLASKKDAKATREVFKPSIENI
jgi:hypothetical protein